MPIVVVATRSELPGAGLRVAGLSACERALRQAAASQPAGGVFLACDGAVPVPRRMPPGVTLVRVADAAQAAELAAAHRARLWPANRVAPEGGGPERTWLLIGERSRRRAEDAVFGALLRADLGLVARWVNKPLSILVTRHLLTRLPVTPNQITLFGGLLALFGCGLIATGRVSFVVAGFALQQAQSMLDGCDGELARVRLQRSALGEWLDTLTDRVLDVLIVAATGCALARQGAGPWAPAAAALIGATLVAAHAIVVREMLRQGVGKEMRLRWWFGGGDLAPLAGHGAPGLAAFVFRLGRRDTFLLAWLALAALGLLPLVLASALVIAAVWGVGAAGQLVLGPAPGGATAGAPLSAPPRPEER